jgi:hypothetical protein
MTSVSPKYHEGINRKVHVVMGLRDPGKFAATVALTLFAFMSMVGARAPHVSIANSFRTPTEFVCSSNKHSHGRYTASAGEVFYYSFDPEDDQYWDCSVTNPDRSRAGTFRFWGDDTHGGPLLFSCVNCNWSLDERGVFFYLDAEWRFWYGWNA